MRQKKWIKDGVIWDGSPVTVEMTIIDPDDGSETTVEMLVINPDDETMIKAGYEEYIEPDVPEEEKVRRAKEDVLNDIDIYDSSSNVNSFSINGQEMWLTVEERQQIATQISANEAIGREEMTKWFQGTEFTFPIATWKQMLVALEVYAGDALNVTEGHKAAVNALTTVEEIRAYDYRTGYPEKLNF